MEANTRTSEWDAFYQDWRVHTLLRPAAAADEPDRPADRNGRPVRSASSFAGDAVTGHLQRELIDATRVHAFALDIALHSVRAEVTVIPLVQASAEVPGDRPWIRYTITLDTEATGEQLRTLHHRIQTTCVQRFEHEYETPIAGQLINTHAADR